MDFDTLALMANNELEFVDRYQKTPSRFHYTVYIADVVQEG